MINTDHTGRLFFAQLDGNKVVNMGDVHEITIDTKEPSTDAIYGTDLKMMTDEASVTIKYDRPITPIQYAKLFGLCVAVLPKSLMCETIGFEPRRHHHKKRINKKWRKRYGSKPVYGPEKEAYIQQSPLGRDVLYVGPDTWEEIKDWIYRRD